jgi:serine/threonine protein kinase
MADANHNALTISTRAPDEDSDHVGSGASTPPGGVSTPRPDFIDKRQPGLAHAYFAQVCPSSPARPLSLLRSATHGPPTLNMDPSHPSYSPSSSSTGGLPPTAPSSPTRSSLLPLLSHEQQLSSSVHPSNPTPPLSSASSLHAPQAAEAEPEEVQPPIENSISASSARLRSSTLSSATVNTIVSRPHVSAQISSPSSPHTTVSVSDPAHASSKELTEDSKSTPPRTPRALSHNEPSTAVDDPPTLAPPTHTPQKSSRSSSSQSTNQPTVGLTKGQLSVNIVQGRGLKPSTAPYVVCIYQLNEDISNGAEVDATGPKTQERDDENMARGVAMRKMGSDQGKPMTIPSLGSRQTSQTEISKLKDTASESQVTEPLWNHGAVLYVISSRPLHFSHANTLASDVVGDQSELDISVYDKKNQEAFIGHVRFSPNLENYDTPHEAWFKLKPREGETDNVSGEIQLRLSFQKIEKRIYGPEDFEILKLIGKGTFGQVFQVRKKDTQRIYAMKVLSKKVIVQKKEIAHTIGERNILVRTATAESPFIVGLKFSFQTPADLYLVTDYMSGGELFWHLQREGRFHEGRAKFYIAELILALRHLHQHDIVYRDLKPENILLDANGHIALCDFGLSKANLSKGDTTNTFCGTTEYLAPEVLLDEQGYTKMVDFWSLGVLVFEMCCGWSPFYAEDTQQMYKNIAFGKVRFPRDALSTEGRNFVKGLLNRNPNHRLGAKADADELMAHAFFADVDWDALGRKALVPPFKPKLKGELDVSNFDPEFTNALSSGNSSSLNARAAALASGVNPASTPLSPTLQTAFKGFTFVDESTLEHQFSNNGSHAQQAQYESQEDGGDLTQTTSESKSERMSGVINSSNEPQGIFNDGMDV